MGAKKSVVIGFKYYLGIHMGLGRSVNELVEIEAGGKKAWIGSVTAASASISTRQACSVAKRRRAASRARWT
ncbi:hypothetical protein D9M68_438910 [compost metagenome]